MAAGWTNEECVSEWVGGCGAWPSHSAVQVAVSSQPHTSPFPSLPPFQPPPCSFSPSWLTPTSIYLASPVTAGSLALATLACVLTGERGREEGREEVPSLPLIPTSKVLARGQPLLAAVWEELTVVAEEKNLAGRWTTWLWFIPSSWNAAGGVGKAFCASTESRDVHIQTSHSFYSKACLIGKILNLAFQDEENRPNCGFTVWVTHLISYWLHVGRLLLG